jgi:hypothetical protein
MSEILGETHALSARPFNSAPLGGAIAIAIACGLAYSLAIDSTASPAPEHVAMHTSIARQTRQRSRHYTGQKTHPERERYGCSGKRN